MQEFSAFRSLFRDLWGSLGEKNNEYFFMRENLLSFFEIACFFILLSSCS